MMQNLTTPKAAVRGATAALLCAAGLGLTALGTSPASASSDDCPDQGNVVVGTGGDDVLVGTAGRDTIIGKGGDDVIRGKGGKDSLYGGRGADRIIGGRGEDCLRGGPGRDELSGDDWQHQQGTHVDYINGDDGSDEVWNYETGESTSFERIRY
jgi:Ca2+-binding RTX toxin-like protein